MEINHLEVTCGHSGLYPRLQPSLAFIIYMRVGRRRATQLVASRLSIKDQVFLVQSMCLTRLYGLKGLKSWRNGTDSDVNQLHTVSAVASLPADLMSPDVPRNLSQTSAHHRHRYAWPPSCASIHTTGGELYTTCGVGCYCDVDHFTGRTTKAQLKVCVTEHNVFPNLHQWAQRATHLPGK